MSEADAKSMGADHSEQTAPNDGRHGLEAFFAKVESAPDATVEIAVLSGRGFLNLRLDPRDDRAVKAAEQALGQSLPTIANTYSSGAHCVYWLGPDEWLVETDAGSAAALVGELGAVLSDASTAVNDVSGGHVALHLGGAEARTVLAKGCTLDLHPREFGPGQCARAGLARATVLLAATDEVPTYTLIVGRSFADYLCRWLAKAARPRGAGFREL